MSGDQEISKASPPRYLRDCLESMAPPISSLFALYDHLCRILTPACARVSNLSSFNILWGPRARGARFASCWEFGAEEQFCSQRGTTGITEALTFEYFLWKMSVKLIWCYNVGVFILVFRSVSRCPKSSFIWTTNTTLMASCTSGRRRWWLSLSLTVFLYVCLLLTNYTQLHKLSFITKLYFCVLW